MKKKWLPTIIICFVAALSLGAQTQQGYVKTPGRLGNNGQVIVGKRLSGVTVQVKGRNSVVSRSNGNFSFPVPGNKFTIQSVKKQGYILTDPETTSRQYTYSSNPLILVMDTPSQQAENKLANERKIRRTLQRQLQDKEDEIEALKEQKKITQEEYQKMLQRLYAEQEKNEKLISDMAERYSQIDFDQLDAFNQRINDCILNGRLSEADSLLRSKGNINTRIAQLHQHHEANERAQATLDKSKAMEQQSRDDIAQDCLHYFEKFLTEQQNDSAAHYLELCASLDTTNLAWQGQAGVFNYKYLADYASAMKYFQLGLRQAQAQSGEGSDQEAFFYDGIGTVYSDQADHIKALEYHLKALNIREKLFGTEHPDVAVSYNNIGMTYSDLGDYNKALEYIKKALDIYERVFGMEHPDVALCNNNLGTIYFQREDYDMALEYFLKALPVQERFNGTEHPIIASSYNNIGAIYKRQGNYSKALEYYQKASNIYERVYGTEHPDVALSYSNIGRVYFSQGDFSKALEYHQKTLDIRERFLSTEHPDVAFANYQLGLDYIGLKDYSKSLEYLTKTYNAYLKAYGQEHSNTQIVKGNIEELKELMNSEVNEENRDY